MSDLRTVVDRVVVAGNALRELYGHDDRAVPRGPASPNVAKARSAKKATKRGRASHLDTRS
jgi:hypothetical protein